VRLRDVEDVSKLTPAMQQYANLKKNNESSLLFFRMGDFYELFFDDAIITAKELNITLTKRGKVLNESIPMCGIPFHAANNYVSKLVKKGFEIAICEQTSSPEEMSLKGIKGPLTREVTRIITPGTLIDENHLEIYFREVIVEEELPVNRKRQFNVETRELLLKVVDRKGVKVSVQLKMSQTPEVFIMN